MVILTRDASDRLEITSSRDLPVWKLVDAFSHLVNRIRSKDPEGDCRVDDALGWLELDSRQLEPRWSLLYIVVGIAFVVSMVMLWSNYGLVDVNRFLLIYYFLAMTVWFYPGKKKKLRASRSSQKS